MTKTRVDELRKGNEAPNVYAADRGCSNAESTCSTYSQECNTQSAFIDPTNFMCLNSGIRAAPVLWPRYHMAGEEDLEV